MSLAVDIVTTQEALDALAPDWQMLWARSAAATPFQHSAWLTEWWRAFHPGALRTVAVRRGGDLVGLAPLYLEDGAYGRRLLPVGISVSDCLDVLLDPDAPEAGAAIAAAYAAMPDWDAWSLEELAPGADAFRLEPPAGTHEESGGQSPCPELTLSGATDADGIPLAVPKKKRQNLRRARAAAAARGPLRIERVTGDPEAFLDALFRLHTARWESRGEPGIVADPRVRALHHAAAEGLFAAGMVRAYLLRIGDRLAAAHYGFTHRGRAAAYLNGFDPAFLAESPQTVLLGHAVAEAAREGATRLSFLRGQEPYKYLWGAADIWNRRRVFVRRR